MIKKSGDKHAFLVPHLRGKAFRLSLLHKILVVVFFVDILYQLE